MDFGDTPEEAAFRAEVRAFLAKHATPRRNAEPPVMPTSPKGEVMDRIRAWQRTKFEAGYAAITWPVEVGGRGGTPIQQVIYTEEEAKFDVPPAARVFGLSLGMCIPTLLRWATPEQKAHYTPRALRGETIWCQLFSEPSAGSDVAGLRTRSERKGDRWIVNGQKIWTSSAHLADYGVLLTRSDPNVPKHKGLTYFFIDMKSPGIEIRPIRQITGGANFNEVYFTDLEIPDTQRLGAVGQGWEVALTTLMNERLSLASNTWRTATVHELLELARSVDLDSGPAIDDPLVREKIADWYLKADGIRLTMYRTLTALSRGGVPGPEASIGKAVTSPGAQDLASFALDLQNMGGILRDAGRAPMGARWQETWLASPGGRVAGGSDEIMRNIIAERVLGLPGEIRVDKDVPFNKLPSGR
jgi:alkylation response protein AidB-like acyl-CoA dehydrogenase